MEMRENVVWRAIILVLSVKARFSQEELTVLQNLQTLFGDNIVDYMIVVFTGGDVLEDDHETLEDYLSHGCPEPLKVCFTMIFVQYPR